MSTEDKRKLGIALAQLSPEDLSKALKIVAQDNPSFQATAEEVDLDIDAQSESTLLRLKFFVKDVLEIQGKCSTIGGNNDKNVPPTTGVVANKNSKRKREISEAIVKNAKKQSKKSSS